MRYSNLLGASALLLASLSLSSCLSEDKSKSAADNSTTPKPAKEGSGKAPEKAAGKSGEKPAEKPAKKPASPVLPEKTPEVFRVRFETTCGPFTVECHREWSPNGADRFFEMLKKDFFKDIAFFRVIPNFMAQFGIHPDPDEAGEWRGQSIQDDPGGKQSNTRGMVTFAKTGAPHSRTTQMFINFKNNSNLDSQGFTPFAKVVEGMENVDKIHKIGERPSQSLIQSQGKAYLEQFKDIDYIKSATFLK